MPLQNNFTSIVVHYPRPSASAVLDLRLYAFWLGGIQVLRHQRDGWVGWPNDDV